MKNFDPWTVWRGVFYVGNVILFVGSIFTYSLVLGYQEISDVASDRMLMLVSIAIYISMAVWAWVSRKLIIGTKS